MQRINLYLLNNEEDSSMKNTTRVVVIGGGVVGCSVLYHLTKLGWKDVVLLERSELTSGSTWHAAGGFHTINGDTNMAALQGYTIKLYKELEEITGMSCGLHHVGGMTLADNKDRFDMLVAERAKHRYMGLDTEIIGTEEIKKLSPITNTEGIVGALYDPLDGHLDPSGTTHAYAKAAKIGGAQIETNCMVKETNQRSDGTWDVVTDKGTIHTEHVVNAGGLWAREVAKMANIYLPLLPMEHQYLITEDIPQIYERGEEHPHVMDPAGESYLRQEGKGLCIGYYEQPCQPWALDGTPWNFGHELLPNNLEKISESVEFSYKRFPVLNEAGIKTIIHGPFTFAPDGNPLVGPIPGLRNYWSACAVMAGFSQGGGVGLMLAQWMIEGETERDTFAMDCSRFGKWINSDYTEKKVVENYQRRFSVSYPNEELPAARPCLTTAMYDTFSSLGAVWGQQNGLEVVNYFREPSEEKLEIPSFRRSNAFLPTKREVKAVRNSVGINELQNFGKFKITGKQSRTWLDKIMAGTIPKEGRLTLNPMLSHKGRLIGDFTVTCISNEEFQLTASYGSQEFHHRWFIQNKVDGVEIENISDKLTGFQIAGPNSRKLLQKVTEFDVNLLKFRDSQKIVIGGTLCLVQRVSYTGDLGFEIYCKPEEQLNIWKQLSQSGIEYNLKPFGMRAMMSLRLDKLFGSWLFEYSPDYTPAETGLDKFINYKKNVDFIGKDAALQEKVNGTNRKLCAFEVEAIDTDVVAYEPIYLDNKVVGFCTSGGYSHHTEKSIAFGFLPTEEINSTVEVKIEIMGELRRAKILTEPLFDKENTKMLI